MLDDAGLAMHENVVGVARHDPHLHPAGCEQIVQAPIALARQQKIEPVLGRLPGRDECSRQRLLPVAGGLGDLHVIRIEIAVADDPDLADRLQRLADDFEQRGAEIAGDPQIARGACEPLGKNGAERLTAGGEALDRPCAHTRSSFSASASSCAAALSSGRVRLVFAAI